MIRLVPYDRRWPAKFETERERIAAALGPRAVRIDHVGSTSIAGLAAKPIIDIDLSVAATDDEDGYLPALVEAGYVLRVRESEHRMLRTPDMDVHVHVCDHGGHWERRHLLFRDWLRTDADDRRAYGDLKAELVVRSWPDMNAYADAKSALIAEITMRAEEWARECGWSVRAS